MKLYKLIFTLSAIVLLAGSCKKQLDDLIVNPNTPTLDKADVDLYLNAAQLSFADFFNGNSNTGMQLTRLRNMGGANYNQAYNPQNFNGVWNIAYRSILTQLNAMEPLATAQSRWHHVAIGQVLKAYTGMTLVDFFGDIPWSEAANPANSVSNPKVDKGADVYAACIKLLDDAIANFAKTAGSPVTNDIYYNGGNASNAASITKWVTLAKTLKLKAFMTTRLTDATAGAKIAALITAGDLIDTEAEDFVFRYGIQLENPNARHPDYNACYRASGGVGTYISNYLAWEMNGEKAVPDPRIRYYFRRQSNARNGQAGGFSVLALSCQGALSPGHYPVGMAYCMVNDGYFGRDHGDASGIPPDGASRAAWGCYPAGGEFDALPVNTGTVTNSAVTQTSNFGGRGAGIQPIWLSSYTHFLRAEAVLTLGAAGDARALLETGVRQSISKVLAFPATIGVTPAAAFVPTTAQIDAYVNEVLAVRYDLAINAAQRLSVVMKEYHIALFGNGIEAYNNYRRTGMPANMQPTLSNTPGPFIRSVWYPADHVTLNTNGKQKADNTVKVFWDNGSANNLF
jgi:Starch-binding associating with outer membrane/Susd and RagB outer membrane lipoprotein